MSAAAPHLVHGMGLALEAPAWPAITADEAAAVLAHFPDAGRLAALAWHSPRPFSAAALVETDRGPLFLKRHHQSLRTPAALAEEHGYMAHLRGAGLAVPDVLRATDGGGAIALGEWSYELHRQAPGIDLYRDRQSWTPFLSPDHALAAGVALAQLHRAAAGFAAPARGAHPLVSSFTILPAANPLAAADAYVAARPAVAAFLANIPWRSELARLFAALGQGLASRLAEQPALWTHNDWHPSNLLWSAEGAVSSIFDFGLSTRSCALHDLATAIERTAVPWLALEQGRLVEPADVDGALALLAGYRSVLPLASAEIDTLLRLLPLVHVEFALTEIDYFFGILDDREGAMLAWQAYLVGHADWFLSGEGQGFLAQLSEGVAA